MTRTCSSLQPDEQVVFNIFSSIYKRKIPMDGNVVSVYRESKSVCVSWLEGYKNRTDTISFEDMLAVHNPDGDVMKFNNISGKSDILIPE